ncbi:F-box/kelch-repeat protein At3g23880-like [Rhodamnia argentea]|uniref:F-box/kelch-repeat protein At3g23880-like n=1 Tax=Rhodamnia argentea TaxID=178133 RepID=A0A8B8NU29_9MYRT|nr:F-box/kelch-repeat protein At3g23880-like [Rhodamnia argentea]
MKMNKLPLAILSDILSRVSSQSLLRFRCVCKRWREAIDDSYFRNSLHCSKERVLLHHEYGKEEIYISEIQEEAAMKMILIGKFPELKGYMLQGACNGFLLFGHWTDIENNPELLINPLAKEILRLPRVSDLLPNMSAIKLVCGFGFDRSANTYKMVQISEIDYDEETHTRTTGARVCNFKKQLWRTCKAPPPSQWLCSKSVFACGALNWLIDKRVKATLSFDLTSEEFSLIPIPISDDSYGATGMHEVGESLALFLYRISNTTHLETWVLKDATSTRREWTIKYRIDTVGKFYYVLGPYELEKLILHRWGDTCLYDVNKQRFTRCGTEDMALHRCRSVTLSLVSLEQLFGEETSGRL